MQPNATNTLLFYSKLVTTALLLAVNPNFAWAKTPCITKSNADNSCMLEQRRELKAQNMLQDSDALAIDHLYYSGGILHNKALARKTTPTRGLEQPAGTDEKLAMNGDIVKNLIEGASSASIYSEIREIFQKMNEADRKSIQKCLRFGTYDAKVDGVWGEQTRDAINNFKNVADHPKKKETLSLFSKIKNVFSRKAVCFTMLDDIFGSDDLE